MTQQKKDSQKVPHGGTQGVAEMLEFLSPEHREKLLKELKDRDPAVFEAILKAEINFDQVFTLEATQLQAVYSSQPLQVWALALRGAEKKWLEDLAAALPKRAYEALLNAISTLGPQPKTQVEGARKEIYARAKGLLVQSKQR